jgi:uncharacterized protein HemX
MTTRHDDQNVNPKRDVSGWALVAITVVIACGTSYVTTQVSAASVQSRTEQHTQEIHDLQNNTVSRREFDQLRNDFRDMRDEMNRKLDKLLERK